MLSRQLKLVSRTIQLKHMTILGCLHFDCTGGKWSGVESAAERDFLRTEGDPGAAGYTIKEAIALARSVVCMIATYFNFDAN